MPPITGVRHDRRQAGHAPWVQDRQGFFWNETLVNKRLEEIMVDSFNAVVSYAEAHAANNRAAAYMLALDRVVNAIKLRGIYA